MKKKIKIVGVCRCIETSSHYIIILPHIGGFDRQTNLTTMEVQNSLYECKISFCWIYGFIRWEVIKTLHLLILDYNFVISFFRNIYFHSSISLYKYMGHWLPWISWLDLFDNVQIFLNDNVWFIHVDIFKKRSYFYLNFTYI